MRKKAIEVVQAGHAEPSEVSESLQAGLEEVADRTIRLLNLGLDALETELTAIIAGTGETSKHDKASRIAYLTSKIGTVADSVRKAEAEARKRLGLTPAVVLAYLRSCDEGSRRKVLSEFEGLSSGGSVLG